MTQDRRVRPTLPDDPREEAAAGLGLPRAAPSNLTADAAVATRPQPATPAPDEPAVAPPLPAPAIARVPRATLSAAEARRIALRAQGFGVPRPAIVADRRPLLGVARRLGLFQIDSVNVLARAHYLPLFSRLGAYPQAALDDIAWGRRRALFEYWAHEASLLPLDLHPLFRWRMARADRGEGTYGRLRPYAGERRAEAEALLARIAADGPLATSDIAETRGLKGWWNWSDAKAAMEFLFWAGHVTARSRKTSFERVYDLSERVLPPAAAVAEEDAQRALLDRAAAALGVATARDLRDYYRLKPEDAHPRIAELVDAGRLHPVTVEGWRSPAFLHAEARVPRRVLGDALLAPFDPLVFERSRAERLFGVRYRIEIYVPAEQRQHGYYVLPFLMDGAIVARVDLKSDRKGRRLVVQSAHAEPGAPGDTAERLAAELGLAARWLDLDTVAVAGRGSLADALAALTGPGRSP